MRFRLKRSPVPLYERARAIRSLAVLLRGGSTVCSALEAWFEEEENLSICRTSRLAALGLSPCDVMRAATPLLGEDLDSVVAAIDLHSELGVDPVPLLETTASSITTRADRRAAGRAASAGAKLSGMLVGGLPLFSLPLLPLTHAPLLDAAGLALLFFGLVLTAAGTAWMAGLVPVDDDRDDPAALFADHIAGAITAGASLPSALDLASGRVPGELGDRLARARRRARLGQPWPDALLALASEEMRPLVSSLERAGRLGLPPGPALVSFARARRAAVERDFERAVRRAPVLMVLPLVLCVLPAFGLLAVVPLLRGITLG